MTMFGARKRIGYISPSVLEVVPFDFYRFAPDGVGLVGVTCNIDDWTQAHFDRALGAGERSRRLSRRARRRLSSSTAAGHWWWRAARATRT